MQTWCPSQKTNRGFGFPCARSSKQCSLVIHQQDALFRLAHVQAHLALETISHFRLIPHWKRPPCPASSRIRQFWPCQGKGEMCYSAHAGEAETGNAGEQPDGGIACRNSSWTMGRARSFRRVLGLGLGGRPTGGGTPPSGLYGFCVETTSDR